MTGIKKGEESTTCELGLRGLTNRKQVGDSIPMLHEVIVTPWRKLGLLLLGAMAYWPLAVQAQGPPMPVIGFLNGVSAASWTDQLAGFHRGLRDFGFVVGRNVAIEYRWADGQLDQLPAMAVDLLYRKVTVVVVGGSDVGIRAATAITQTVPIVFMTAADPIAAGLVVRLNPPEGNATGISVFSSELEPKKLELLHELIPGPAKIALLVNPNNPITSASETKGARQAALRLGLEIVMLRASTESEIESAFETARQQQVAGLQVSADAFFSARRDQIAALALRYVLPTIASSREAAVAGNLMGYGAGQAEGYRRAGVYVGRILKGEKPNELPVELPTKFELTINLKTAKELGISVPTTLLARADHVIQ